MKHVAGGVRLAVALLAISAARCSKGGESAASPLVAETIPAGGICAALVARPRQTS